MPHSLPETLRERGAVHLPDVLDEQALAEFERWFDLMTPGRPGYRAGAGIVSRAAGGEAMRAIVASWLGKTARAVRVLLLDKRDGANWSLDWHQDRTIAVREHRPVVGFTNWTRKSGQLHVMPPMWLLEQMVTVRVHLDRVDVSNAPLLIAPGSNRFGWIAERDVMDVVARCGIAECLAERGDAWFYATPILHASARADAGRRRRVVQIDFAACDLPGGLEWSA